MDWTVFSVLSQSVRAIVLQHLEPIGGHDNIEKFLRSIQWEMDVGTFKGRLVSQNSSAFFGRYLTESFALSKRPVTNATSQSQVVLIS